MAEKDSISSNNDDKVYFHPEQVKYIERIFPEVVFSANAKLEEIHQHMGCRKVVHFMKGRVK